MLLLQDVAPRKAGKQEQHTTGPHVQVLDSKREDPSGSAGRTSGRSWETRGVTHPEAREAAHRHCTSEKKGWRASLKSMADDSTTIAGWETGGGTDPQNLGPGSQSLYRFEVRVACQLQEHG